MIKLESVLSRAHIKYDDFILYIEKALNERKDCSVQFVNEHKAILIYKEVKDGRETTESAVPTTTSVGDKRKRKSSKARK